MTDKLREKTNKGIEALKDINTAILIQFRDGQASLELTLKRLNKAFNEAGYFQEQSDWIGKLLDKGWIPPEEAEEEELTEAQLADIDKLRELVEKGWIPPANKEAKMEAKVMSFEEYQEVIRSKHWQPVFGEPRDTELDEHMFEIDKPALEAQAKITAPIFFREGRKAGIQEVVEWINQEASLWDKHFPFTEVVRVINEQRWQAFLKELGY